ncbi:MAG: DNA internalization-related competence protein ComEC/Rec2 [Clostridiales bacterium]|nr:DNA internalization-related competence protein ComEC/Rec2 [Clostridiales bacterium]
MGLIFLFFFKIKTFTAPPCLFVLGFILSYNKTNNFNALCDGLAESRTTIRAEGKITDISDNSLTIKTDNFGEFGKSSEPVKIICYTDETQTFSVSDTVSLTGKLNNLNPKYNPSDFDEIQYYRCRGINYKMYDGDISYISSNHNLPYYMSLLRRKAGTAIDNMYTAENSGILKAMLLGDKAYLSDEIKLLYKNAGIYHVLAISGLHISLIATALMLLFRKPSHSIIIILMLFSYALFTGLSPSVVRAVIMMSILLISRIINRRYDLISSISFSAFIILAVNPMYLRDCGFLYSYSSVFGLALFAKPFSDCFKKVIGTSTKPQRFAADSIGASTSAVIISKLINMWFFYSITVYDIISNLVVLPLMFTVILSSALSILFYVLNIKIYVVFAYTAQLILNFYKITASAVTALPYCTITTGRPVIAFAALYIIFIIALKTAISYKNKAVLTAAAAALILGVITHTAEINKDRIAFLYVGQGDGVVGFAEGKTFVSDGGGTKDEPDEKDEGTYTILPYLNYMGKTRVDYAFISHIDNDHMKGVYELIGNIEIGEIFLPKGNYSSELYTLLTEKAAACNIPITYLSAGDTVNFGKNSAFRCVYPFSEVSEEITDINDTSMVLNLSLNGTGFLFTGDITSAAESEIVKSGSDISADVIKTAHHGSKYSSSEEFIAAVSPFSCRNFLRQKQHLRFSQSENNRYLR